MQNRQVFKEREVHRINNFEAVVNAEFDNI
ncbi:hypothetical protein SDC9_22135 [bioreactor metagenome]|uniref:Uncharacterized protein n=1 Tax=bioreactor metagenome TaxID=1076179 RepID=A0A644UBT1_9ZZZZ